MKRFILISGIFFYFISASITVMATFFFSDEGKPDEAYVVNHNTGARVWQPNMEAFDLYQQSRFEAITKPELHNTDASNAAVDLEVQQAYGRYWSRLHADKAPSVSGGNAAYTEAVCWHCHSQFVRPMAYENYRWGPTSQIGESAHENPTRFGTRRIGPDLTREGGARSDDWHYAHFDHPRFTVPQSAMAPYGGISRYWKPMRGVSQSKAQSELNDLMAARHDADQAVPQANADVFKTGRGKSLFDDLSDYMADNPAVWALFKGRENGLDPTSRPIVRAAKMPEERTRNLVAYVQTRGLGIGVTKQTDDIFIKTGTATVSFPSATDPKWLAYIRKLEFNAGIWRLQEPATRPLSRPDFVLAPGEYAVIKAAVDEAAGDYDADGNLTGYNKSHPEYQAFRALGHKLDLSLRRGSNLFVVKCGGCHGGIDDNGNHLPFSLDNRDSLKAIGNGYGPAADYLIPEPRNFHLGVWPAKDDKGNDVMPSGRGSQAILYKNRSGDMSSPLARPEDLFHTIRNGMAPSSMPAWPFLREREIWDIVNFIMFLGDGEAAIQAQIKEFEGDLTPEEVRAGARTYWNPNVAASFAPGPGVPRLGMKDKSDKAAVHWAGLLGWTLPDAPAQWTKKELIEIGAAIFARKVNGADIKLASGGGTPECIQCHGSDGDSWSSRRGEMISSVGFPARNYYIGQFKLGASHDGIWRAMRYGINNSPMNAQIVDDTSWSPLEVHGIIEFILDKRSQGVMGIK